ncbi:hypothetical protein KAJ83_09935 [Marivibrio halodurans]|uniref:Uncharacterized protein n=1 Tax=Marivibrio halodurans TaxID=2039722 RepID=A0A8J7SMD0_9PROT|nr:hypothetical protein [Marivibrio halodurans]MBP5857328.1 hypothetical protein [Marivibrio halodurans]
MDYRIEYKMPFSLKIDVESSILINEKRAHVRLRTNRKRETTFPGLSEAKNAFLENDDTNHFEYTEVTLFFSDEVPDKKTERITYKMKFINDFVLKVSNHLIDCARICLEDYVLQPLSESWQLGPLNISTKTPDSESYRKGSVSAMFPGGGISNFRKPYSTEQCNFFKSCIESGYNFPLSTRILADANHYVLKNNFLMASANLSLGFEVYLNETIRSTAKKRKIPEEKFNSGKHLQ